MAGLAAARTNNDGLGVAGVCAGAQVLNMECSDCSQAECDAHVQSACKTIQTLCVLRTASAAADLFLDAGLRTILVSSARQGNLLYADAEILAALWSAYVRGVNFVAPSADTAYFVPRDIIPAAIPFVIGVGGHVHDGRFWEPHNSCYSEETKGTTIGPGLDICGPACPWAVTTIPFLLDGAPPPDDLPPEELGPYWWTSMQCSGAAAVVAGSVAYLHAYGRTCEGEVTPNQDDIMGLLLATARPFTENPLLQTACPTCERSYYGRGMVDLERARRALDAGFCWYGSLSPYLHPEVVTWGDPRMQMEFTHEFNWNRQIEPNVYELQVWREYVVTAAIAVPPTRMPGLPGYVLWANPTENAVGDPTTARGGYGQDYHESVRWQRVRNAEIFTNCEFVWQDDYGAGLLRGYAYEKISPVHEWMVEPSQLQMAYTYIADLSGIDPAGVGEPGGRKVDDQRSTIQAVWSRDGGWMAQVHCAQACPLELRVIDVGGRLLRTLHGVGSAGSTTGIFWDGRTDSGDRVASGIYWLALGHDRGQKKRLVVVR